MKIATVIISCTLLTLTGAAVFGQTAATATAVTNTPPPPKNPWDASAAAGLTLTRGNSRTLLFSGSLQGTKKWDKNEVSLGADGVYGENADKNGDEQKNAESIHGFGQYNRLFTERLFGYFRLEGLHDAIADIDYRLSLSPGVGYYFIKAAATSLRAEVGPGYIYEMDHHSTTHSYMTLRLAEHFEQKLSDSAKLWQSAEVLPQVDKFQNYILNFELGVEASISKKLSLQTVLQDSYHSEPANNRLKNDLKLIAGVKYKI